MTIISVFIIIIVVITSMIIIITTPSAGSSGGTAGVVASRGVPAGFCSDTAGSCRIPGAHTGTVGFRPSLNCYNAAGGIVPQTTSRDTVGTFAAKHCVKSVNVCVNHDNDEFIYIYLVLYIYIL